MEGEFGVSGEEGEGSERETGVLREVRGIWERRKGGGEKDEWGEEIGKEGVRGTDICTHLA